MNNIGTNLGRLAGSFVSLYFFAWLASRVYKAVLTKKGIYEDAYIEKQMLVCRRYVLVFLVVISVIGYINSLPTN